MTLVGLAARKLMNKKRNAKLAAAFPNGIRCQKCLEMGHWSYECKDKRKFVHRSSRTKQLSKRLAEKRTAESSAISEEATRNGKATKSIKQSKEKRRKRSNSTSGSSSDDSSSSESSSSSDSDDDSGSSDSDDDSSDSSLSSSDSDSDSSDSDDDSTNSESSDSSSDGDADSDKECNNKAPKSKKPISHSTDDSSASSSDGDARFQD